MNEDKFNKIREAVAERQERLNNQILTVETEQEEAAAKGAAGEEK